MVHSPNSNIDFFIIVTGVFQERRLASFLGMNYVLQTSKERKWFHTKKKSQEANNILQKL